MTYTVHSKEEFDVIADRFAKKLRGGEVVALLGDLGAGKTTFVQGCASALGITARVKSPTFAVMHEYEAEKGTIKTVYHLDLYRFEHVQELSALELEERRHKESVVFVEWPQKIDSKVLGYTHIIKIDLEKDGSRTIDITYAD